MRDNKYLIFVVSLLLVFSAGCVDQEQGGDSEEIEELKEELEETKRQLEEVQNTLCSPTRIPVSTTSAPEPSGTDTTDTTAPSETTDEPAPVWYEGLSAYQINSGAERISYDELVRENEDYKESIVTFKGQVSKIWGSYDWPYGVTILTKTNSAGVYNDEAIYLADYDIEPRLVKGDIINFWGVPDGFQTVSGSPTTVPQLIPLQAIVALE